MEINYVRVLPYDSIVPSAKFPPHFEITFPFQRLFGNHLKQICVPDQQVAYYFSGGKGASAAFGVSTGHDFLQTVDTLYVRLSWRDVGVKGKRCGMHWQVDNKQVWTLKALAPDEALRKKLDEQLAKAKDLTGM